MDLATADTSTIPRSDTPQSEMAIEIDTGGLSQITRAQIATLRHKIKLCHAYSLFYYNKSRFWNRMGWVVGIATPLIAAVGLIINAFYTECETLDRLRAYNTISNAILGALMGIFAFIDVGGRRKENEEGGDEYYALADGTYTDAFLSIDTTVKPGGGSCPTGEHLGAAATSEQMLSGIDYSRVIERFITRFECLNKIYPSPPNDELKILMKSVEKYPVKFVAI